MNQNGETRADTPQTERIAAMENRMRRAVDALSALMEQWEATGAALGM